MKIAVLGTGMVGDTIGSRLVELGHEVKMGSRTAGNEKAKAFVEKHQGKASAGTFADAAAFAEVIINCTAGSGSIEALKMAGEKNIKSYFPVIHSIQYIKNDCRLHEPKKNFKEVG